MRDATSTTTPSAETAERLQWRRVCLLGMFRCALAISILWFPYYAPGAPVHLVDQPPITISSPDPGVFLIDFGKVAFGNLHLIPPAGATSEITVHLGEALAEARVDREPAGTVRYAAVKATPRGAAALAVAPQVDRRNTQVTHPTNPPAVLTPPEWGVVTPFRWVEIEGWPGELNAHQIVRRAAFASAWDDDAAAFRCSDDMLNQVWELCRYTIKATTYAGVYVDGDRERIPYEADSYLNQLSHYATDNDIRMARDTFDWQMRHPTWPTEWAAHMVFMAHADWMHTGDTGWLEPRYEALKSKLLLERTRADGLVTSTPQQIKKGDIVDWPKGERDGYVFTPVNTVVNAFHLRTLRLMAELADALGNTADAQRFRTLQQTTHQAFLQHCFDPQRGVFTDGPATDHASLHANLFSLAFGLVPAPHRACVTRYVAQKGMACSVYAAQYLLEGLFENGAAESALQLITAPTDRSWRHMVQSGATITWEAWDLRYKSNLDWNHAWGAAPANLLPRFVLGARPVTPGWDRVLIKPHPGSLTHARGKIPTPRGPIGVAWKRTESFELEVALPPGVRAKIQVPTFAAGGHRVLVDGQRVPAERNDTHLTLLQDVAGTKTIEVYAAE